MKPGDSVVITSGALRGVPGRVRRISPRTSWATVELLQPAGAYDVGDTVNVPQYELKQTASGIVITDIGAGAPGSTGYTGHLKLSDLTGPGDPFALPDTQEK